MQLFIDKYGIKLSIGNNRLCVERDEKAHAIHPSRLSAIHIFTPCTLTSPVAVWAAANGIAILMYNGRGQVVARLWEPHFGSQAAIRIAQPGYCQSAAGPMLVKGWLLQKALGQLQIHQRLAPTAHSAKIKAKMQRLIDLLQAETGLNLDWMRRLEAMISRWHWTGIALALRQQVLVAPRNLRPAKDRFNTLINYLYGTLYGLVEGCQIAAGLDPHISIMHRMDYNRPSLVFDMIEPFRPWADAWAVDFFTAGLWKPGYAEEKAGGIMLTREGKKNILTGWFAYLDERSPSPKKMIRRRDQVQQACTTLAANILRYYNQHHK